MSEEPGAVGPEESGRPEEPRKEREEAPAPSAEGAGASDASRAADGSEEAEKTGSSAETEADEAPDGAVSPAETADAVEAAETSGASRTPGGSEAAEEAQTPSAEAEPSGAPQRPGGAWTPGGAGPSAGAEPTAAGPGRSRPGPQAFPAPWGPNPYAAPYPGWGPPRYGAPPRPRPPRPPLPETPRWLLPAALGAGALAALLIPFHRPGLGLLVAAAVAASAVFPAARGRLSFWTVAYTALAGVLAGAAVIRDAGWLVSLDLAAAFGLAALAVSGAGRHWFGALLGGLCLPANASLAPRFLTAPLRDPAARRKWLPALISAAVTAVLLIVFGALFASADPVFAHFAGQLFDDAWLASLPFRAVLFAATAALVGTAVLVARRPVVDPEAPQPGLRVGPTVWAVPLAAVNLLFLSFVAVQAATLFGGNEHILNTADLTYAEYARQGFFQLVVVSAFVLGIIAVSRWLLSGGGTGKDRLLSVLLGLLCCLTLVILASALDRLGLYTEEFGLTRLRTAVTATAGWIGTVFVLVLVAGVLDLLGRPVRWLPRTVVLATGLALALFTFYNPDARIAESMAGRVAAEQEARSEAAQTYRLMGTTDTDYLRGLSADAVPAIDALPEPARSCALIDLADRLDEADPWTAWNSSRHRARAILEENPVNLDEARSECTYGSSFRY
ncbi:hypothetical protein HDA32_004429 [Spinactinospora alkalitolerans]|uniref:DUF4173 domain-containing protein n=1 Tax=Spinactinospora alkalitolerans TaxID=687207 RepID=A0A852TZ90_9ACTN|nr:DUF4153 domain-containing protein [Spinactinospora alkalitolerans]NYE49309.1 hypothetical protein [Spinactinospora alkalitolerans]